MGLEEIGVKLVTEGQSSFESALSSATKSVDKFGNATDDNAKQVSNLGKETNKFQISLTDLKSGFDMASKAVEYAAQVYDQTVAVTVKYAEQVRDLGRISGATAEETSRLIQTADDLKVEYGTLQAAAKALAKDGIALTTEELAKSSDEYLAITDAGERAEYATKKFGRAGLELTKVLETGGDALRQMAKEQGANLILSEKQVQAARELEKAEDALQDSITGLKYVIGNGLIPEITKLIQFTTDYVFWVDKTKQAVIEETDTYPEYLARMGDEIKLRNESNVLRNVVKSQIPGLIYLIDLEAQKNLALTETQYKVSKGYFNIADEGTRAADAQRLWKVAVEKEAIAANDALEGSLKRVTTDMEALTTRTLYNNIVMGIDNPVAARAMAEALGLINQATVIALDEVEAMNKKFEETGDIQNYTKEAQDLAKALGLIQSKSITIDVKYTSSGSGGPGGNYIDPGTGSGFGGTATPPASGASQPKRGGEQFSDGGAFKIPVGFGHEGFDLGGIATASGGETVVIVPKNVPAGPSNYQYSYATNYNLNLSTQQTSQNVQQSFAIMRMLAG